MPSDTPHLRTAIHSAPELTGPTVHRHSVEFYESDAVLLDGLCEYVAATVGGGSSCVVIATPDHRASLEEHLRRRCFDVAAAIRSGRYLALDAKETLSRFMVDGWPDSSLFFRLMESILLHLPPGEASGRREVGAYGEMVALLWAQGKTEAAIRLEQLWNELAGRLRFRLHCAYPIKCFGSPEHIAMFEQICAEHTHVGPAESYAALTDEDARLRMVSSLQQKAEAFDELADQRQREIERRTTVEEMLRQTQAFASNVLENSVDCVKVLDLDGRVSYMSPPGQKALEISSVEDVLGRRWVDFWNPEDQPHAESALRCALDGGLGSFCGLCSTPSGVPKWWDVKISPVVDENGNVERLIAISRDISELKQAQSAVIEAEKLAATGRMAASIAHEINNPLEAVTNLIYLARTTEGMPQRVREDLLLADQELARVAQIAQQTLGFYRDSSHPGWVGIEKIVDEVLAIYERKLRQKEIVLQRSAPTNLLVFAKGGELKQVVANLILNAIDASRTGGRIALRVSECTIWRRDLRRGVRLSVADQGSGMSSEVQRKLFTPFFTTKNELGTGIGLWVTKNIIERYGGSIRFRSRQGENSGTVMTLFIPIKN